MNLQEPFDADEFVERLAWRTVSSTRDEGDQQQFDPILLNDTFVQSIK
jgi:exocyst complex component 5